MMTFNELCIKHNCDKGKLPGGIGHNYSKQYESILEPLRELPIRLLEIGVGDGKSINVWLDYFTHINAKIVGVDKDPVSSNRWRYEFLKADQTNAAALQPLTAWAYDVIIDDGSHMPDGTITAFEMLWPFVKRGGYYVIEDLKTSYLDGYQARGWGTQMSFIKRLLDDINAQSDYSPAPHLEFNFPQGTDGGRGIEWLRMSEELCIIKKK